MKNRASSLGFQLANVVAHASRYQFNPHLLHPETVTNILVKALTVFPSPAFSLCLALLPPSTTPYASHPSIIASKESSAVPSSLPTTDFTESIQKLTQLSTLLESASYTRFWSTLSYSPDADLYSDLTADVAGFDDLIRIRIAGEVGKAFRKIELDVLSSWLDLQGDSLIKFLQSACGWKVVDGKQVLIPPNAENEAKSEVRGERVGIEMFGRVLRRGLEQAA